MDVPNFDYFQLEKSKVSHNTCISCILTDADTNKVYVGGLDGTIKIWTLGATAPEGVLRGHRDLINAMVMLQDKTLITASDDKFMMRWDLKTKIGIMKYSGHEKSVTCCIAIYNRRLASSLNIERDFTLVSGSWDETINIWDASKNVPIRVLKNHLAPVKSLVFYESHIAGKFNLASGSHDGEILVWDLPRFNVVQRLSGDSTSVNKLVLNDENLISSGQENSLKIWTKEFRLSRKLDLSIPNVRKVVIFRGKFLIALCGVKTVEVWNIQKKELIQRKEFTGNLFEITPIDQDRLMIANRSEGWVFKYVNKPMILIRTLHKFRTEKKYPPILVKHISEFLMEALPCK